MSDSRYLDSSNIHLFPFGSDRTTDHYARVLNEYNLTQLIKNTTDYKSYVLSYDSNNNTVEFVIQGYYVKALISEEYLGSNLYAHINLTKVDSESTVTSYTYISGNDDNSSSKFTAVTFSNTSDKPDDKWENHYYLKLLDESGNVPVESKYRFFGDSINLKIDTIYCGSSTEVI